MYIYCLHFTLVSSLPLTRSDTTQEDLGELVKTNNPEEISIDDDFESDDEATVEGTLKLYTRYII